MADLPIKVLRRLVSFDSKGLRFPAVKLQRPTVRLDCLKRPLEREAAAARLPLDSGQGTRPRSEGQLVRRGSKGVNSDTRSSQTKNVMAMRPAGKTGMSATVRSAA